MSMSNDKPAMPTRVAVEAAYSFTDEQLAAWVSESGWGKPTLYPFNHHLNPIIARVIAAFPA